MDVDILSLFPDYFRSPLETSILMRAQRGGQLRVGLHQLRDFTTDKHQTADDRPYGGGPGMVLKPEPIACAIRKLRKEDSCVIYLSPQGALLTSEVAKRLCEKKHLILLCGHYEGVDQRVIDSEVDEEISIGDYILTNGCLAALVLLDATSRFIPGVLGNDLSAAADSFQEGLFGAPQYTRPEEFEGVRVPEVLLGGNHAKIEAWRKQRSLEKTLAVRGKRVFE